MQDIYLDSSIFRQLYNKHQTGAGLLETPIVDTQIPVFESFRIEPALSSSSPSAIGLNHNKTIHSPAMTSITEPSATNLKRKRNKSFDGDATSTEVTSPGGVERPSAQDIYDFDNIISPPRVSSRSSVMKLKIWDAERNDRLEAKMTHTRTPKRSKTTSNVRGSQSIIVEHVNERSRDDGNVGRRPSLPSQNHDIQSTALLPSGRERESPSRTTSSADGWEATEQIATRAFQHVNTPDPFIAYDVAQTMQDKTEHHVVTGESVGLRSISENSGSKNALSSGNTITDHSSSSGHLQVPHTASTAASDGYTNHQGTKIIETRRLPSSLVSVVPSTLTASQKMEYKLPSMPSTASSGRSSLPDVMTIIDPNVKWSGNSSTVPNETPRSKTSSDSVVGHDNPIISSPLVTTASLKRQRSGSLVRPVLVSSSCFRVNIRYLHYG